MIVTAPDPSVRSTLRHGGRIRALGAAAVSLGTASFLACSDYNVGMQPGSGEAGDDDTGTPTDDDTPPGPGSDDDGGTDETLGPGTGLIGPPPGVDMADDDTTPDQGDPPELPPCDETIEAEWPWWGSQPFSTEADPVDAWGRPFFAVDFDMVDFSTVSMPDAGHIPSGTDKVYRAAFTLDWLPSKLFLSMQSDDGLWFYANGTLVGHWGGDWQAEGCVNDDGNCTEYVYVDPVDILPFLHVGDNVVAARVSNPIMNAFFDVYTECVD